MGLLDGTNQATYYGSGNAANYGNYQFTSLEHIINAFMVAYVGESKILSKVNRTDVQFHAMRAVQELSYDVLKSFKSQEIEVPNTLSMILPQDYVNYTKIARIGSDGIERVLYPASKTSDPFAITQNTDGTYDFGLQKRQITISATDGADIADGDYLALGFLTSTSTPTVDYAYFIMNDDNDVEDGANPAVNLTGPRFSVPCNTTSDPISTPNQIANALKEAIENFGHHTCTIDANNVLTIEYNESMTVSSFEGFYAASGAPGGANGTNFVVAVTNSGTAPGNNIVEQVPSNTSASFESQTPANYQLYDINYSSDVEISAEGRKYGLDPQYSQINGSFFIDQLRGLIKFSSELSGKTITLHYVSDGLGTDAEMVVHKFCEEAVYKHIAYGILSTRSNIPPFIVQRFKKERFAETRKAKIRLSNIKIEEFTQVLKGMGKQIK
tara:strand:- start:523 stop:1845 length:1323 start_codon:yes stop_codon:yes gene_type:complete